MGKALFSCVKKHNSHLAGYIQDVLQGPVISHAISGIHILKGWRSDGEAVWYQEPWLTSPNEFHDTLQLCNNVRAISKNNLQLRQDNHVVEEVFGDHVGMVVFGG